MKKLISELRKMIYHETVYSANDLLRKLKEIEDMQVNLKPKGSKFVQLMDGNTCVLLRRKHIASIKYIGNKFVQVYIEFKNGDGQSFKVEGNEEVLENLIADFKG